MSQVFFCLPGKYLPGLLSEPGTLTFSFGLISSGQNLAHQNVPAEGNAMPVRARLNVCLFFIFLVCSVSMVSAVEREGYVNGIPCGGYAADLGVGTKCSELTTFFDQWQKKADRCDPEAQTLLGLRYTSSSTTWREAVKWFKKAADQGYASAQYELGIRYEYGEGVLQDFVFAHVFYNLSASMGYGNARLALKELTKRMTPDSVARAQKMARNWKPSPCIPDKKE
jgi:hypothetical protein